MAATDKLFRDTEEIVIHSFLNVAKVMINDKHCFELYGFDVMIDSDLRPWLIEANSSPALTATSKSDYELKFQLLKDTLDILDLEGRRSGEETQVGGYDLVYCDGQPPGSSSGSSPLGSYMEPPGPEARAAAEREALRR